MKKSKYFSINGNDYVLNLTKSPFTNTLGISLWNIKNNMWTIRIGMTLLNPNIKGNLRKEIILLLNKCK